MKPSVAAALSLLVLAGLSRAGEPSKQGAPPAHDSRPARAAVPGATAAKPGAVNTAPLDPEKDAPGLKVGDTAPECTALTPLGAVVPLSNVYSSGPIVLVFYRGGWCPFCSKHLAEWSTLQGELGMAGAGLVFVSPESFDGAKKTVEVHAKDCTILCDADGSMSRAFRVAFEMPPDLREKYKGFGVDLEKWNASRKWELPAPATFVIDQKGVIRWAFADWDYKKRADPKEVVAFVKQMTRPAGANEKAPDKPAH